MINEVRLIGNLGRDVEIINGRNGSIAKLSLATTASYKDKNGEWQSHTEWHRVVAFGNLANRVDFLRKGNQVYVSGSLQTRKWEDNDGIERYTTEIKANKIKRLGPKEAYSQPERNSGYEYDNYGEGNGTEDNVPF